MTITGVDAAGRLSGAAVRAAGHGFAARYIDAGFVSHVKTWLSRAEVADLRAHGVGIVPTFEIGADDVLAGRTAARERARRAVDDLAGLGMADAVAFWTADRDIVASNLPAALDYARGWSDVIGRGRRGCYGDRDLLDALFADGLVDYGWQPGAASWSGRTVSLHAHIVQLARTVTVGGVSCDLNEVRTGVTDYGQWPRPSTPAPSPAPERDEDDMVIITAPNRPWLAYYPTSGAARVIGSGEQGPLEAIHAAAKDVVATHQLAAADYDRFVKYLDRGYRGAVPGLAAISGGLAGLTTAVTGIAAGTGADPAALAAQVRQAAHDGVDDALNEAAQAVEDATG